MFSWASLELVYNYIICLSEIYLDCQTIIGSHWETPGNNTVSADYHLNRIRGSPCMCFKKFMSFKALKIGLPPLLQWASSKTDEKCVLIYP